MARCSHCEDDRLARCSYADCPFEVEEAQRTNETFQTRITELEAEVERLMKKNEYLEDRNEECEHWRIHWKTKVFEAISRTGAVKVKVAGILYAIKALDDAGFDDGEFVFDSRKELAEILSALEPAAPEGQQPVAYRVHAPADEHYGIGPDRLQFHPLAQYDLDNGYRQTPLYTRRAEQAVTEAMVEAALAAWDNHRSVEGSAEADDFAPAMRAALKAAMEAGRHD